MLKKRFVQDLSLTFTTQIVIAIINIFILRIISIILVEEQFGVFLIVRRVSSVGFPILTLNLGMSLARFCSLSPEKSEDFFRDSMYILITIFAFFIIIGLLLKDWIAVALFKDRYYNILIIPLLSFLLSESIFVICIGYLRGRQQFIRMNVLSMIFWVISIATICLPYINQKRDVEFIYDYLFLTSGITIVMCILMVISDNRTFKFLQHPQNLIVNKNQIPDDLEFIKYGATRLPAGFLNSLIFYIPIFIATTMLSLKIAAYIGILIAIVRLVQVIGQPFNMLFIPKFASYVAGDNSEVIRKNSELVLEYCLTFPILLGIIISFFSNEVILLWFGEKYIFLKNYLFYLAPTTGFLIIFLLIRGVIDGLFSFPYSNIITSIAAGACLIVSIVLTACGFSLAGLTLSVGLSLFILGAISIYIIAQKVNITVFNSRIIIACVWNLFFLVIVYFLKDLNMFSNIILMITFKCILMFTLLAVTYLVYQKLNFHWLRYIHARQ